ncbi:DUF3662 domain-containing protein, partial [Nakamurella lactea]|uniref:DUF3662 domain-containing protein n=1 Tax=Nakamurella lactea TaxID=459515 RepID=UPI000564C19D
MGVIQNFERRLQGVVAGTFARLFGGSVHPSEVAGALQQEAAGHLQHQGSRTIAPNHYTVRMGRTDTGEIGDEQDRVSTALSDMIREYLDQQGWQTFGDIEVTLEESSTLHTGQFRISSLIDPDTDRRERHRRTGVGQMSQHDDSGRPQYDPDRREPGGATPADQHRPEQGEGGQQGHDQQGYQQQGYGQQGYGQQGQPYGQPAGYDQGYPSQGYEQQAGYGQQGPGYDPNQGYQQPGYDPNQGYQQQGQ